jgi:hypothetical protein
MAAAPSGEPGPAGGDTAAPAAGSSSAARRRRAALAARAMWAGVFVAVVAGCLWWRSLEARAEAARTQADRDFVANLFGGERGLALLREPRDASAWRLRGGAGRPVTLGPRQHQALVAMLTAAASYDRVHPARPGQADATVRLEDEHGSLNLVIAFDTALLEVYVNGSRLGQACVAPARPRLLALLREVLAGDAVAQAWR